jgi:hypothetical protein
LLLGDLRRHSSVFGSLSLTVATVSADSSGLVESSGTGAGVHGNGLADDEAITDQLADGLAGVGVRDLVHLVGVEPDLALAAADDRRRQALLGAKVDPDHRHILAIIRIKRRQESWTS